MNVEACHNDWDDIAGDGGYGWQDAWGEEQIFQYIVPRLIDGTKVLDIFAGFGRASLPLAMHGAEITGIDNSLERLDGMIEVFADSGLSNTLIETLAIDAVPEITQLIGKFDVVLAVDALTHLPKTVGKELLGRLRGYLKNTGGYLMVNAPGVESGLFEWLRESGEKVDIETYLDECGCSGEIKMEPFAFYYPGEIESLIKRGGGRVIDTRLTNAPEYGNYRRSVVAQY